MIALINYIFNVTIKDDQYDVNTILTIMHDQQSPSIAKEIMRIAGKLRKEGEIKNILYIPSSFGKVMPKNNDISEKLSRVMVKTLFELHSLVKRNPDNQPDVLSITKLFLLGVVSTSIDLTEAVLRFTIIQQQG